MRILVTFVSDEFTPIFLTVNIKSEHHQQKFHSIEWRLDNLISCLKFLDFYINEEEKVDLHGLAKQIDKKKVYVECINEDYKRVTYFRWK
jgi:hypothetical protein